MLNMIRTSGKMTHTIDKVAYTALLAEYQPKVITTEEENERALEIAEKLMMVQNRTPEQSALLKLLVILIEKFEDDHYQLNAATPQSILQHLMEARGIRQEDLIGVIGSRGVVSEVVDGKRSISKKQAKALGEFFHISPELFI
jgi:HTH-type transcriptional regulator/antitoxin HigA